MKMLEGFKLAPKTVVSITRIALFGIALITAALLLDTPTATDKYDTYAATVDSLRERASIEKKRADSLDLVIQERNRKIAQSDRRVQTLNTEIATLRGRTSVLVGEVDSLKETLTDSVEMAREIIPRQEVIIKQKDEEIKSQGLIITEHLYTIQLRDRTITDLTVSNDSLTAIVISIPSAPPNPNKLFGLIPMPSRTAVLVIGVGAGVVAGIVIAK